MLALIHDDRTLTYTYAYTETERSLFLFTVRCRWGRFFSREKVASSRVYKSYPIQNKVRLNFCISYLLLKNGPKCEKNALEFGLRAKNANFLKLKSLSTSKYWWKTIEVGFSSYGSFNSFSECSNAQKLKLDLCWPSLYFSYLYTLVLVTGN